VRSEAPLIANNNMPDEAVLELREMIKGYLWLRLKSKEIVGNVMKAL